MRKLVAVIACRNQGSRLFGKPLQNLSINSGWTILDNIISNLKRLDCVEKIILAIAEGSPNTSFVDFASIHNLPYIIGDEKDVLKRLISGLEYLSATDLFRVTSESPFLYWNIVKDSWLQHLSNDYDATFLDNIIDGCGFEIIKYEALVTSWNQGSSRHRSELCSLFIREFPDLFKTHRLNPPESLHRNDLRLTVDYPEDLVVCRAVYEHFASMNLLDYLQLTDVVEFLDQNPFLKNLVAKYTEAGYATMYL